MGNSMLRRDYQAMSRLQSAMHAKLEESQQKSRALRKNLEVKERELELARKTIGRLCNERTLMQAEFEAGRARLKRVEGTLLAMRSLDTKANVKEYKAKIKHLKEELELAEERAAAEHKLAERRRQEVNILKRALHLRDEDMAAGYHSKLHDQLADCPLHSFAQALWKSLENQETHNTNTVSPASKAGIIGPADQTRAIDLQRSWAQQGQIQQLHPSEFPVGSKVTDEMCLPNQGTPAAMIVENPGKCEALQSQISILTKDCERLKDNLATYTQAFNGSVQACTSLLSENSQLQEMLSDLVQEKEDTSRLVIERVQRYAERLEAARTVVEHELQEHAFMSQVHVSEMTQMNSSGLQEIMSLVLGVADTQASQAVLQTSSRHPEELNQVTSESVTRVQQALSDTAREAQQSISEPAQKKCNEGLLEQAPDGHCQAMAHETLPASMEQSMNTPTTCGIVESLSSSMPLARAISSLVQSPLLETGGSQQHANELSPGTWATARKSSTAEYYSNEMELY